MPIIFHAVLEFLDFNIISNYYTMLCYQLKKKKGLRRTKSNPTTTLLLYIDSPLAAILAVVITLR